MIKTNLIILFSICLLTSCYKDNEEYLYGEDCKTENISYSDDIVPLLENQCLACHSDVNGSTLGGNVVLEGYANLKIRVDDGSFLGAVSHDPNYSQMPKNADQLNECSINTISIWIDEGALDN